MDESSLVPILIGVMVIVIVGGLGLVMSRKSASLAEDRLAGLMGLRRARAAKKQDLSSGILARPAAIDLGRPSFWTRLVPNAENLNLLYEQADVSFSFKRLLSIAGGLALAGVVFGLAFRLPFFAPPVLALVPGLASLLLADQAPAQADPPVRRGDARGRRADQPGTAVRARAGLRACSSSPRR